MKDLINIKNEDGKQLLSAKELYLGLGLNEKNWSRWYPTNIENNGYFEEEVDWVGVRQNDEGIPLNDENLKGGRPTVDFAISIDFAKHIAMMARTEKSHEYRNYFIQCEKEAKELSKPQSIEDLIIMQANSVKELKGEVQAIKKDNVETKQEIQAMRDVITLNPTQWKADTTNILSKIAKQRGVTSEMYKEVRDESYKLLEQKAAAKLNIRLTNMRRKVLEETGSKSKADKISKIDVIASEKKLIEIYISIVTKMAIKYKVA